MTAYNPVFDPYNSRPKETAASRRCQAVVKSDTKDLTDPTGDAMPSYAKRLYIGVSGDVKIMAAGDTVGIVFKAHPVGYLDMQVRQVFSTGTTATDMVALMD